VHGTSRAIIIEAMTVAKDDACPISGRHHDHPARKLFEIKILPATH
jgi:hypothetical protein